MAPPALPERVDPGRTECETPRPTPSSSTSASAPSRSSSLSSNYSSCGLGSPGTDLLVQLVRESDPGRGLYGAKITGGGSGGTVAVLGRRGADLRPIVDAYSSRTGHRPYVFSGSSPGAGAFGRVLLTASAR